MKHYKKLGTVLALSLFALSCQHEAKNPKLSSEWHPLNNQQRKKLIKKYTQNYQHHKGLNLLYDINVTFLSEQVLLDNLKMKSQFLMWDSSQARDERSKMDLKKLSHSFFFVTVYSNNRKLNQLNLKSANWTASLILEDGTIHKGTIKLHDNLNDNNTVFYPHVESWDKNYMVTFDVPTSRLAEERFKFDLTSPRLSKRFNY